MGRLLLLILLVLVALIAWRKLTARAAGKPAANEERPAEAIVACAHCGLHVPASEALRDGDHVYCCPEHLRRGCR